MGNSQSSQEVTERIPWERELAVARANMNKASAQPNASVAGRGPARVAIGCVLIRRQAEGVATKPLPLPITPRQVTEALWEAKSLPRGGELTERAINIEKPNHEERARIEEKPTLRERANEHEKPILPERAIQQKSPDSELELIGTRSEIRVCGSSPLHIV